MTTPNETVPGAAPEATTTPNVIAQADAYNAANLPASDPAPGTAVDTTSEYDSVSTYEPKLKKGTHTPLCKILGFEPAVNRETQEYQGWRVTLALAEDAPNEFGGVIAAGTRLGMFTIFTTPSQYRSDEQTKVEAKRNIMALHNIVRDRKTDPRDERAEAAFRALPSHAKAPGRVDHDAAHYEQWKDTYVRAVLTAKEKDGEIQVNCNGFLAKDTPAREAK